MTWASVVKRSRGTLVLAGVALITISGAAQQPVRDSAQSRGAAHAPTGAASIVGLVVNDQTPGRPVRRATVTLTGSGLTTTRSEVTDDDGAFVFRELPPGRYSLAASRPAFVRMAYGARRHDQSADTLLWSVWQINAVGSSIPTRR
jgi:protocatechuate 3,4-dioxygenase beta subunit